MKKLLATILITSTLITPCLALTATECQQIQQTAHQMAECARQLGYPEDSVIIQEAQKKWWEAFDEEQELTEKEVRVPPTTWNGSVLTKTGGVNYGPSGKETYYNLPMGGCISRMRRMGYDEERYPVWTRFDGAKMLGPFIMCAASLDLRPLGTVIESSRGWSIVVDTGGFAKSNPTQIDIATNWR